MAPTRPQSQIIPVVENGNGPITDRYSESSLVIDNILTTKAFDGRLCKALGVRMVTNPLIVALARNAGFDCLFIDLEHSSLSLAEASAISYTATLTGIMPLVRLPWQCGSGYVQQVLDGGAMGVIFPHIVTREDAYAAVQQCKFPPWGKRSMWGQQPVLGMRQTPLPILVETCNAKGSSVLVMIEALSSLKNLESIAAVEGVDTLLVGCLDLSTDMGIPGNFDSEYFRSALIDVSQACRRHGKVMGLAGIYNNPSLQSWAINDLGVRFMLCQQDSNLIASAAKECVAAVVRVDGGHTHMEVVSPRQK
ncbi:hypothetical protein ACHAPC_010983 [Botrytis cinerea]